MIFKYNVNCNEKYFLNENVRFLNKTWNTLKFKVNKTLVKIIENITIFTKFFFGTVVFFFFTFLRRKRYFINNVKCIFSKFVYFLCVAHSHLFIFSHSMYQNFVSPFNHKIIKKKLYIFSNMSKVLYIKKYADILCFRVHSANVWKYRRVYGMKSIKHW